MNPLYLCTLIVGLAAKCRLLQLLAVSAILHLAFDFPFHHGDAHAHFWPISDWRFVSPVSYWNPDHFGNLGSVAAGLLAVLLVGLLWRRFHVDWVRGHLAVTLITYIAVPAYFTFMVNS